MKIKLNEIKDSTRVRKQQNTEKLDELANSIAEIGQLVPILVTQNGNGYQVVFGHRRVAAMRMKGFDEIEAIIDDVVTYYKYIFALSENVNRENMIAIDKAKALQDIKDMTGWTNEKIGQQFGWSHQTVSQYLDMLDYSISARAEITSKHVKEAKAGTGGDKKVTEAVLEKASEEGWSTRETRRRAEDAKKAYDYDGERGLKWALNRELKGAMPEPERPKPYEPPKKTSETTRVFQWLRHPMTIGIEKQIKELSKSINEFHRLAMSQSEKRGEAGTLLLRYSENIKSVADKAFSHAKDLR